jgi:hypothetical protein
VIRFLIAKVNIFGRKSLLIVHQSLLVDLVANGDGSSFSCSNGARDMLGCAVFSLVVQIVMKAIVETFATFT